MDTDTVLNNIIAYYSLLVAIILPVIIFLVDSIKDSPKMDKQVLFKKVFPLKHLGILLGFFILPGIQVLLFNSNLLENVWTMVVVSIITVVITGYVFYSVSQMMAWILSGEKKEAFHNFYRRNLRKEFLDSGSVKEKCDKWSQFWSDEKIMGYFGNDISVYIDDFFKFLSDLKDGEWDNAKKCCAAFYYDIPSLYKIGRKIDIKEYDDKSFASQLGDTIPFSICYNLFKNINMDNLGGKNGGMYLQRSIFLEAVLEEMEKDDELDRNCWILAFSIYSFGTKREKQKALAVIILLIAYYRPEINSKRDIKKRINKLISATSNEYVIFYRELYKEMFDFNPKKSALLKMLVKDK